MCQDESAVVWYHDKEEKQLELCHVSRIIPGQRTVSLSIPTSFFPYKGNFFPQVPFEWKICRFYSLREGGLNFLIIDQQE